MHDRRGAKWWRHAVEGEGAREGLPVGRDCGARQSQRTEPWAGGTGQSQAKGGLENLGRQGRGELEEAQPRGAALQRCGGAAVRAEVHGVAQIPALRWS
ncbi:hypothetical protein GOP47_0030629 [Adiantum capillus-veneris]|nr:hypothetical protein GOP47_0031229 [Adiantum capillus-veneris]KAI5054474.1 hypothetical protein GOP47_0030629 [Adiantum capillus-veneris]